MADETVEDLKAELESERSTIEELLQTLEEMELSNRGQTEDHLQRERELQEELLRLSRDLEDERNIRLQQMFVVSKSQAECEEANVQKSRWKVAMDETQSEQLVLVQEIDNLKRALEASSRQVGLLQDDLQSTTRANLQGRQEGHFLRLRLVEAERDASVWRDKYEGTAAELRSAKTLLLSGKVAPQRAPSGGAQPRRNVPHVLGSQTQKPAVSTQERNRSKRLPALLPPR